MITVQMREQDGIDRVVRDSQSFKGDEARSPEVDAEANARRIDKEARVEPSSGTERVSGAHERDTD